MKLFLVVFSSLTFTLSLSRDKRNIDTEVPVGAYNSNNKPSPEAADYSHDIPSPSVDIKHDTKPLKVYQDEIESYHHEILPIFVVESRKCSGTLYRNNTILTSGFCADRVKEDENIKLMSMIGKGRHIGSFKIVSKVVHPKYKSKSNSRDYDIGMIFINTAKDNPILGEKIEIFGLDYWKFSPRNNQLVSHNMRPFINEHRESPRNENPDLYDEILDKEILQKQLEEKYKTFQIKTRRFNDAELTYSGAPVILFTSFEPYLAGVVSEFKSEGKKIISKVTEISYFKKWIQMKENKLSF